MPALLGGDRHDLVAGHEIDSMRAAMLAKIDGARDGQSGDVDYGERVPPAARAVVGHDRGAAVRRDHHLVWSFAGGECFQYLAGADVDDAGRGRPLVHHDQRSAHFRGLGDCRSGNREEAQAGNQAAQEEVGKEHSPHRSPRVRVTDRCGIHGQGKKEPVS